MSISKDELKKGVKTGGAVYAGAKGAAAGVGAASTIASTFGAGAVAAAGAPIVFGVGAALVAYHGTDKIIDFFSDD